MIRICCFDPGSKNLAFGIEEIDISYLSSIKNITKIHRYGNDGFPTESFNIILDKIKESGKSILYVNENVKLDTKYLEPRLFLNINTHLDKYSEYFDTCSIFLIEKQMSFGRKINTMGIRVAQHCMSYLLNKYGEKVEIIDYPAYYKSSIFGCKGMKKSDLKKWSYQYAFEIWQSRGDYIMGELLERVKKRDDISDCLLHILSFVYLRYIDMKL